MEWYSFRNCNCNLIYMKLLKINGNVLEANWLYEVSTKRTTCYTTNCDLCSTCLYVVKNITVVIYVYAWVVLYMCMGMLCLCGGEVYLCVYMGWVEFVYECELSCVSVYMRGWILFVCIYGAICVSICIWGWEYLCLCVYVGVSCVCLCMYMGWAVFVCDMEGEFWKLPSTLFSELSHFINNKKNVYQRR